VNAGPAQRVTTTAREQAPARSEKRRLALIAIGIASIALLITGCGGSAQTRRANLMWANAACTSMLDWQKQIHHAETNLNLALGPQPQLNDAIAATRRFANELGRIGLPATQRSSPAEHRFKRLMSNLQTQMTNINIAANKLENGNSAAAQALVDDLGAQTGPIVAVLNDLRQVSFTDLGIAMLQTKACRQAAGIPI
jgi:hypothetical protein